MKVSTTSILICFKHDLHLACMLISLLFIHLMSDFRMGGFLCSYLVATVYSFVLSYLLKEFGSRIVSLVQEVYSQIFLFWILRFCCLNPRYGHVFVTNTYHSRSLARDKKNTLSGNN